VVDTILRFFLPADELLVRRVKKQRYKSVSVYGTGEVGMAVVDLLQRDNIHLEHWYDSKITHEGSHFLGIPITPFSRLKNDESDAVIVASESFTAQIHQVIESNLYRGAIIKL